MKSSSEGETMSHDHTRNKMSGTSEKRLWWAVGANLLLTIAQVVGGIISGSLSLVADALHNFSDAASLLIALVAIRIGRKPSDEIKTFGYKRAETIAALINLTSLVIIGIYLVYEGIMRFISPEPIAGWTVVIVAGIALVVDVFTAVLTFSQSKSSMNIKAAFLHNLSDALASIGVIITGSFILLYGWIWTDAAMTLIISFYVLYQGFMQLPKVIHLLMEGVPENINLKEVIKKMESLNGVKNIHHVHVWQLDEDRNALEAHVVIEGKPDTEELKQKLKKILHDDFSIEHSTLEFELTNQCSPEPSNGSTYLRC